MPYASILGLERGLRRRMKNRRIPALPIYPEERDCRRPSARRVFDLFEPVLRHHVTLPNGETQLVVTELTEPQRQVLALLDIDPATCGKYVTEIVSRTPTLGAKRAF